LAAWRVVGGTTARSLNAVARATKTGFETAVHVKSALRYFAVQALDAKGDVLGTSAVKAR
jgi:hypothetical protein